MHEGGKLAGDGGQPVSREMGGQDGLSKHTWIDVAGCIAAVNSVTVQCRLGAADWTDHGGPGEPAGVETGLAQGAGTNTGLTCSSTELTLSHTHNPASRDNSSETSHL